MARRQPHRSGLSEINYIYDHCNEAPIKWLIDGVKLCVNIKNHWFFQGANLAFAWYRDNVHIYLLPLYDYHMVKLIYNVMIRGYPDYI